MNQEEAERIAAAITKSGHLKVKGFQPDFNKVLIRCDYSGETIQYNNSILTGHIMLWIKSPAHWANIRSIIENGTVVPRRTK